MRSSLKVQAALFACIGFGLLALFQVALALGAPFARFAWGGRSDVLPPVLRQASAIAVLYLSLGAYLVPVRAGVWSSPLPPKVVRLSSWALVFQLAISTVGNLASASPWERAVMTPISVSLALCCFIVARKSESDP